MRSHLFIIILTLGFSTSVFAIKTDLTQAVNGYRFEPNRGQFPVDAPYLSYFGSGLVLFFNDAIEIHHHGRHYRLTFQNPNPKAAIEGYHQVAQHQYHRTANSVTVPAYQALIYKQLYPGIDAVFYDRGGYLEFDFHVHPGADPAQIAFTLPGANVQNEQRLLIDNGHQRLILHAPRVYQRSGDDKHLIDAAYQRSPEGMIGFQLADFQPDQTLIIDPVISLSQWSGSLGEGQWGALRAESDGSIYLAGITDTDDFPGIDNQDKQKQLFVVHLPAQSDNTGTLPRRQFFAFNDANISVTDMLVSSDQQVYVTGFRSNGNMFVKKFDFQAEVAPVPVDLDAPGPNYYSEAAAFSEDQSHMYITGYTSVNASGENDIFLLDYDLVNGGGAYTQQSFGGAGNDQAFDMVLDGQTVYLAGASDSPGTFIADNHFDLRRHNKLQEGVVIRHILDSGSTDVVSLGGSAMDSLKHLHLGTGQILYVAGDTWSTDLNSPQESAASLDPDAFYAGIDLNQLAGNTPAQARLFVRTWGGSNSELLTGMAATGQGIMITGETLSNDIPENQLTGALQHRLFGGQSLDGFLVQFDTEGDVTFGTLFGGSARETQPKISYAGNFLYAGVRSTSMDFPHLAPFTDEPAAGDVNVAVMAWDLTANDGTDLSVTTDDPVPGTPAAQSAFSLPIKISKNRQSGNPQWARLVVMLPAGLLYEGHNIQDTNITCNHQPASQIVVCDLAAEFNAVEKILLLRFRANGPGNYNVRLQVWSDRTDTAIDDNVHSTLLAVQPPTRTDLALSLTPQPNPAIRGKTLRYTHLITNNGPGTATGLAFTADLDTGVSLSNHITEPADWSCSQSLQNDRQRITCELDQLTADSTNDRNVAIIRLNVIPNTEAGSVNIISEIRSDTQDSDITNNRRNITTGVGGSSSGGGSGVWEPSWLVTIVALSMCLNLYRRRRFNEIKIERL